MNAILISNCFTNWRMTISAHLILVSLTMNMNYF